MLIDKISDLITRIRNGQQKELESIYVYKNKLTINFLNCLIKEGYIRGISFIPTKPFFLKVLLKYDEFNNPTIKEITRISKPSRRRYIKAKLIATYHQYNASHKVLILSTNKGIMTHQEALNQNLGGEIMCKLV